ncbi:DUF2228 domain-containing protein [Dactylosporangium sp. AC04546]|uniref:ADP-ribosylation family protein n=1 Tax=Dactylosporangium sp. AC04546 TaxID=2862460 RepID=UPI001EDEF828|nr:ADP-ribosylation family protein [Dactylosporangium sp. AC04546]WVK88499.1 DUF2228 domain-containing protein [Dactylosporangium sp. AC04546]
MHERFPEAEAWLRRVYGLRLPRHLGVFAEFWQGLTDDERAGMRYLGLSPWGISELFDEGGVDRTPRDGLDPRLDCRFRRDPAEFVTVMSGDSDGLHFGLWYDDPAELPSFIAYNYARDSAETWTQRSPTVLAEIGRRVADARHDAQYDHEMAEGLAVLQPLESKLEAFADADRAALDADGPRRWADAARPPGGVTLGGALPPGSGATRAGQSFERMDAYRADPAAAEAIIAEARAELADGFPAYALSVGSELHWWDGDPFRAAATELLTGAYRALGREALAEIVEVHHANRDLRSVDVL